LSPKGKSWNRLERALDVSKNVSEPAKNVLGNSPLSFKSEGLRDRGLFNISKYWRSYYA
jgi:hypothetical protein